MGEPNLIPPVLFGTGQITNLPDLNVSLPPLLYGTGQITSLPDLNIPSDEMQKWVIILSTDPIGADAFNIRQCNNFKELAAEINRKLSTRRNMAEIADPDINNPMPGFVVKYLSDSGQQIHPQDGWELFASSLDEVTATPEGEDYG